MSTERTIFLLKNATADGKYPGHTWNSSGEGTIQISGVWDGATVTIQGRADRSLHWETLPYMSTFVRDMIHPFKGGNGDVRAVIANAGASTKLSCAIVPQSTPGE